MLGYYEYTVRIIEEDTWKNATRCGVICASSYTSAMKEIVSYYGDDNIIEIKRLFATDNEGSIYEFDENENTIKTFIHGKEVTNE